MNGWIIFVTAWIVYQSAYKAAKQPRMAEMKGWNMNHLTGAIFGSVMWGVAMIGSLYMAGLYS